ncbi:MAG: hypothetical protein Q4A18_01720 [Rikenellaceae bacterium]|nr:hypothetical protein [Rikenellaceae bacterium]
MKRLVAYLLVVALFAVGFTACSQSEGLDDDSSLKGESELSLNVEFRALTSQLTRSAGDAVKHIDDLCVVIYKEDGSLMGLYPISSFAEEEPASPSSPAGNDFTDFAESSTCRVSFSLGNTIPFGRYRFYVVANYTPTASEAATEESLRNISFTWSENVASNKAMFGFMTPDDIVPTVTEMKSQAPLVTISQSRMSLYGWVRRMVSKVTVGFDGTNLNENIYIYIHTVQLKDIPATCLLGADNVPDASADLIANGETIYHRAASSSDVTEGLRITKGNPTGGTDNGDEVAGSVHHELSNALYLFENLQGTSSDKHQYKNYDSKDNKPYGSYIEVKGYYVNKSADNASQGPIIYRFMLGKNTTSDFNTERNNHFKLTLRFKNNANDPDWHIVYEQESPELSVPNPLYISYGYNEYMDIPIVIQGNTVSNFSAEIIDNPWGYDEHKYSAYQTANYNGFLSFTKRSVVTISEDTRKAWANSTEQKRTAPTSKTETATGWNYKMRVWTRPLTLQTSFTGHNPFTGHQRIATVRIKATVDGVARTMDTKVIQVRRAVNPVGIWRSGNKQTPFEVKLMEMDGEDTDATGYLAKEFFPTISDGPWSAEVIEGEDWVQIKTKDSSTWGNAKILGGTGSEICFDYRPGSTIATTSYRGGVIKVLYHNYNCVHYIFVSQGLGTVNLAGTNWHTRNVEYNGKLVANPLLEGGMFKFGCSTKAYLPINNIRWGWKVETDNPSTYQNYKYDVIDTSSGSPVTRTDCTWRTAEWDPTGGFNLMNVEGGVPPTQAQWVALESLRRYYGVMYGDECTSTIDRTVATYDPNGTDAYMYMAAGQTKGMQGVFIWDDSRGGNHTFFPLSATGFGHRKAVDKYDYSWGLNPANAKYGVLQYGQRSYYFPDSPNGWDGKGNGITIASSLPVFYDLWLRKGVIYWYRTRQHRTGNGTSHTHYSYAHDFNYFTMGFETYLANSVESSSDGTYDSDMAYVRCVVN